MILSDSEDLVFSSLGWVDGGTVWVLDSKRQKATSIHIGTARYVSLYKGQNNHFSVAHNFEDDKFEVSIHKADRAVPEVARFSITPDGPSFTGDASSWINVPKAYVSYFEYKGVIDYWLCIVRPKSNEVFVQNFDWYDNSYDKGYQGIVGVVEVPDSNLVLVSVQRDSSPVLFDPLPKKVVQKIVLDERHGNPKLQFNLAGTELWADDYDTLVKIDRETWSPKKKSLIQPAENGTRSFIGNYWLNNDETLCVVPRPFSSDVVALDTETLRIKYRCEIGRQPLEAVMLRDSRVFARDWKSGELLTGKMTAESRFSFFN